MKIGYNDVMMMPTGERRYFLSLLIKNKSEENERIKQAKSTGKGKRTSTISGDTLKSRIKSGDLPLE